MNQSYVIGTSTKVDISGVNVDKFDDKYFAKQVEKKKKKGEGEFFEAEKEVSPFPYIISSSLFILLSFFDVFMLLVFLCSANVGEECTPNREEG